MISNTSLQKAPLQSLKGRMPFRLGTTSYIIPGDILPNVEYLSDYIDDIELVLFETDEMSNLPDSSTILRLNELAATKDLSYTVHFPMDIELGSNDPRERTRSVDTCKRIIDLTAPLEPFAYIVHFHGSPRENSPAQNPGQWRKDLRRSMSDLLTTGIDPALFCVETLEYDYKLTESVVLDLDLGICLDVGHVLLTDQPLTQYYQDYLDRTRVLHLHGIVEGKDHRSIAALAPEIVPTLLDELTIASEKKRVLTLEIFDLLDFETSLETLTPYFK